MSGPLHGVKILDFTRLLPGPFGTMILGDLGAEIVRLEAPNFPDLLTVMPPMQGKVSAGHRGLNRNKRSMFLDLKKPGGVDVVKRLVKGFDVVVEQFRPGVMERLGVGYDVLAAANPGVVYCSITGYGQDGPYRLRAGHDLNYLSIAGVMSYMGRKDSGPLPLGIQVADQCAGGMNAVIAILAALIHKEKTGEGQYIDISMTDGAVHLGALYAGNFMAGDAPVGRENNTLNGMGYYDVFETKDGQWMSVGSLEPQFYKALCEGIGRQDLIKDHMSAMGPKAEEIKTAIKEEFLKKTRAEWEKIFAAIDACVEPVLSIPESLEHPHIKARGMVVEVEDEEGNKLRQIGSPYKMSKTPSEYRFAGVIQGSHTSEVMLEEGFTEDEIAKLKEAGVVK